MVEQPEDTSPVTQPCTEPVRLVADRMAQVGERRLQLTGTEFRLLQWLLDHPGLVCTRQELLMACLMPGTIVLDRTIDQHVCALRRKLGKGYIRTVRSVGYCFEGSHHA